MTGPEEPARRAEEAPMGGVPDGGDRRSARLVAVAVLAAVLFGWPFLVVFDQPVRVLGASHFEIVDGRVLREWRLFDELAILTQISGARTGAGPGADAG